jgi:hypothetical protein
MYSLYRAPRKLHNKQTVNHEMYRTAVKGTKRRIYLAFDMSTIFVFLFFLLPDVLAPPLPVLTTLPSW